MIGRYMARKFCTAPKKRVGFLGLGNMGLPMVKNLLKNGYTVTAYDINKDFVKLAEEAGAKGSSTVKDTARDQDVVVTMLPNTNIVEEARLGKDGIYEHASENALIIDSSTISPIASQKMTEQGTAKKLRIIDAPVSGGVNGAINGTLTFMVGCRKEDFEETKTFLSGMGKNIVHCGGAGTGQIAKICNNLALAIQMISVCEALNLGEKLGIDPKVLSGIMSTSTSNCWSVNAYNPRPGIMPNVPSSNNYDGGFGVSLIKKDLSIVLDSAAQVNLDLQFGQKAIKYYHDMDLKGMGKKDFSIVYRYISELKKNKGEGSTE